MRKALIAVSLLFALCLGGVAMVHRDVNRVRDQVVITEETLFGDKTKAEGLTIRAEATLSGNLMWDTTYTIGEEPATQTEYRFTTQREQRAGEYEPSGLYSNSGYYVGDNIWREAESIDGLTGLDRAYWQLLQEVEPGEEKDRQVPLSDYYEYYPTQLQLELPTYYFDAHWGGYRTAGEEGIYLAADEEQRAEMMRLHQTLTEYIKIPVLEGEQAWLSVSRNPDGSVGGVGHGSGEGDCYYMEIYNAITDNACYFIVDNLSSEGKVMDMSLIPGGHGIHRLSYGEHEKGWTSVDVDSLSMVYPLDEMGQLIWFETTADKSKLLLMTVENGDCLLRVIDCASMDTLQELVLYQVTEKRAPAVEALREGCIVLRTWDGGLMVLDENEEGLYDIAIDIPLTEEEQINSGVGVTLWDGERLAMAVPMYSMHRDTGETSGFLAAVYGASGPLFGGRYTSSLDTKSYNEWSGMNCTLWHVDPLHLSWKS